jgi:hypothetical protein
LNISKSFIARILRELAVNVPRYAKSLLTSEKFVAEESDFLREAVAVIEIHVGYVTQEFS